MCIELVLSNKFIDLDPPVDVSEGKNQPATTWFSACPRMLPCSLHALWCFAALGWAHSHSQLPSSNDGPQRLQTLQAAAQHTAFQLRTALFFFSFFFFSLYYPAHMTLPSRWTGTFKGAPKPKCSVETCKAGAAPSSFLLLHT